MPEELCLGLDHRHLVKQGRSSSSSRGAGYTYTRRLTTVSWTDLVTLVNQVQKMMRQRRVSCCCSSIFSQIEISRRDLCLTTMYNAEDYTFVLCSLGSLCVCAPQSSVRVESPVGICAGCFCLTSAFSLKPRFSCRLRVMTEPMR
jgi:hypothetical protein